MMNCAQAKSQIEDIESTIKTIKSFKSASVAEKSYLAKYLVVYISGLYEECIECILNERISSLGSKELDKFAERKIEETFRNPDIPKLAGLLGLFDDKWKEKINNLPMKTKEAFNFMSRNKNLIAHGSPCTITIGDVVTNFRQSKKVIRTVDIVVKFV
jgi:hypothetical protein